MADERAEFRAALEEVRQGSDDAISEFIKKYGPYIRRIARRHLDTRMQSKFDSIDFEQMVWVSFFRNPSEIRSFRHPDDVTRFLVRMLRNKLVDEHRRRLRTIKHDVTRERPLHGSSHDVANRADATPSQVAIAREEWNRILNGETERNKNIARLRLGGATIGEISQQLEINERTVRRAIEQLLRSYEGESPFRRKTD